MAELNVQPKKNKTSWLPWLIAAIIIVALLLFFLRGRNNDTTNNTADTTAAPAPVATTPSDTTSKVGVTTPAAGDWSNVDQNAPAASYEEITDKNISVRGNDNYGIYSLGEDILFDHDKSTIRKSAEPNLKQIAASINKRFNGGDVRIYGYTDSTGTKGYNKQLAEERAASVRSWLAKNGNIDSSKISLNPIGEGNPVASNGTAAGRQENRRVEIIAKKP